MANIMEQVKSIMTNVFQVNPDRITTDLVQGNLPEWDSFHHMDLIMSLEENFGITISDEDVVKMHSFSDVIAVLKNYGVTD